MHSYTSDGTRWCWVGAVRGRQALDAELISGPVPDVIARRLSASEDPWRQWTALEVEAKLTDTPVLALLQRGGGEHPAITCSHQVFGQTLVCLGVRHD